MLTTGLWASEGVDFAIWCYAQLLQTGFAQPLHNRCTTVTTTVLPHCDRMQLLSDYARQMEGFSKISGVLFLNAQELGYMFSKHNGPLCFENVYIFITSQNEREETTQNTTVPKSAACASYKSNYVTYITATYTHAKRRWNELYYWSKWKRRNYSKYNRYQKCCVCKL